MAEAPGILAWIVSGAKEYIESGLRDPSAIVEATAEYQTESDPVGDFIARYLEVDPGNEDCYVTSSDLRRAWLGYTDQNDVMDINARQIGIRLKGLHGQSLIGSKTKRISGQGAPRVWTGFRLNNDGDDLKDHGEDIERMRDVL